MQLQPPASRTGILNGAASAGGANANPNSPDAYHFPDKDEKLEQRLSEQLRKAQADVESFTKND